MLNLDDVVSAQIQRDSVVPESRRSSELGGAGAVTGALRTDTPEEALYELHLSIKDKSQPHFVITDRIFRGQALASAV